ncbi:MAG: DUF58 domain-containing protein [Pseudomarimonas sp.]
MSDATAALIPPELAAQLRGLRIVAKLPPAAGPLGQNASRQRGQGLEFSQYRAYEPGDEPRHIDWKLFARSDRYFVREAESEAGLAIWVVVDCSGSMAQSDLATPDKDKLSMARTLAAATIDIALREGDRFGLLLLGGRQLTWVTSARGPRHRDRCVLALTQALAQGEWPSLASLQRAWERIEPAAVVVMIGDGFDEVSSGFALQLAATRRDVRCISLTSVDERDFDLRGAFVFEDPETGARLASDGAAARNEFRQRFVAARQNLAQRLATGGVRHVEHVLDQPLAMTLAQSLGGERSARRLR